MQKMIERQKEHENCGLPAPREPPAAKRCVGCPYPSIGFMCWCERECLRTEMVRIRARDAKKHDWRTKM